MSLKRAFREAIGLRHGSRPGTDTGTRSRVEGVNYCDGATIEKTVFICGLHRSGTTLLERLLAAFYDVAYLRADVPESEGQHLQDVYSPAIRFGGPGQFAFSRAMSAELDRLTDFETHKRQILESWSQFVVGSSPILIEKSPPNLTKIRWLRQVFPNSHFIIMARDPRAVASATRKWARKPLPELIAHWNSAYSQALEQMDPACTTIIRYEDMVARPDSEIDRVAREAGLTKRTQPEELESRYAALVNSNPQYLGEHSEFLYGQGVWSEFDYDLST